MRAPIASTFPSPSSRSYTSKVEMGLLRMVRTRPDGGPMVGSKLEGQGRPTIAAELNPVALVVIDRPARDRAVERSERFGIWAIEHNKTESSDACHCLAI